MSNKQTAVPELLVRVNLSKGNIQKEKIGKKKVEMFLGGRGLGAELLYEELATGGIDPLGVDNKLIFCTGALTGTGAYGSSRYCITTKSPLTGIYLMTIAGGHFGSQLRSAGCDVLIVEGKAEKPVYLVVSESGVEIKDAARLWGMGTDHTQEFIQKELGDPNVRTACIGPAGEQLVPYACLINERRAAARGGAGAVMGSKNLKAIVVKEGARKVELADPAAFRKALKQATEELKKNPATSQLMPGYGTPGFIDLMVEKGIMPWKNWQESSPPEAKKLGGVSIAEMGLVKWSHACSPPCPVRCGKVTLVTDGPYAGALADGPEYETLYALGACCQITDVKALIYADSLCDSLGLDTMSMGLSLSFAMECYEKGIITKQDTDGEEIKFGDAELMLKMIHATAYRRGFGEILSLGTKKMAERFGKNSEAFAMHAKGMEFGGYEMRGGSGTALVFACGPRGGCHHAGGHVMFQETNPPYDRFSNEGKGALVKLAREKRVMWDSAIMCTFLDLAVSNEVLARILSAAIGSKLTADDLHLIADRVSNVERAFNVREGLRRSWDTLPARMLKEPLKTGPAKGGTVDLEPLLDDFYSICGWDIKTGIPNQKKLKQLGLEKIAEDMQQLGG